MAKKLPAFQLYTGDWKKDPELSACSPATRGIWIDLICAMHDNDRCGMLSGTPEMIARIARCTTAELDHALTELSNTGAADVTMRNEKIQICNRRMRKEWECRNSARLRVKKHREKEACNAKVTSNSSFSSSFSSSKESVPPSPLNEKTKENSEENFPAGAEPSSALVGADTVRKWTLELPGWVRRTAEMCRVTEDEARAFIEDFINEWGHSGKISQYRLAAIKAIIIQDLNKHAQQKSQPSSREGNLSGVSEELARIMAKSKSSGLG